jgi:hypothetical protein
MTSIRYAMCALLALGNIGHIFGTFQGYRVGTEVFVWSLSGAAFVACVIVLNLFALSGRKDHLLAAAIASILWAGLALAFGSAVGNILDPRALAHAVPAAVLALLNLLALREKAA